MNDLFEQICSDTMQGSQSDLDVYRQARVFAQVWI
jgi:hypothetical protein